MNSTPLASFTITIPAGTGSSPGFLKQNTGGATLLISAASAPFVMQFDTTNLFPADAGYVFSGESFSTIGFYNSTANAINVTYVVGTAGVTFIGNQNTKVGSSYAKGNMGINSAASLAAFTGSYVVTAVPSFVSRGTGYKVGDLLTVAGGTGTAATVQVTAVGYSGAVESLTIVSAGQYTANPSTPNSATGGTGTSVQITLTFQAAIAGLSYTSPNLIVATASAVLVNNFDGANRRKMITFTVAANSSAALQISDLNSCVGIVVTAGQTIALETSAQFLLSGSGGSATFSMLEIYYSS